jgi:hypothetical protein
MGICGGKLQWAMVPPWLLVKVIILDFLDVTYDVCDLMCASFLLCKHVQSATMISVHMQ